MASLTLSAGAITSEVTASNTKAQNVLTDVVALHGGPTEGTQQEQADFVVALLVEFLQDCSRRYRMPGAVETAEQDVADDGDYHWEG